MGRYFCVFGRKRKHRLLQRTQRFEHHKIDNLSRLKKPPTQLRPQLLPKMEGNKALLLRLQQKYCLCRQFCLGVYSYIYDLWGGTQFPEHLTCNRHLRRYLSKKQIIYNKQDSYLKSKSYIATLRYNTPQ